MTQLIGDVRSGSSPAREPPASGLGVRPSGQFPPLPRPVLKWTPEVQAATAHLYERVARVIPPVEWPFHAPM